MNPSPRSFQETLPAHPCVLGLRHPWLHTLLECHGKASYIIFATIFNVMFIVVWCGLTMSAHATTACIATLPDQSGDFYATWHWILAAQLPAGCVATRGCTGHYVPPLRDWVDGSTNPELVPWRADADYSRLEGNQILLEGDVFATKGYLSIEASRAILDRETNEWFLTGPVEINDPTMFVRGQAAIIHSETGLGAIEDAHLLLYDQGIRGSADYAERTTHTLWNFERVSYTTCEPNNDSWWLTGQHLMLDEASGVGVAKHAKLYLWGVPVVYTPYLSFPLDKRRKSGWLTPSLSTNDRNGLDATVPYYFNVAPNADATVAPRVIQKRGVMAEAQVRHLSRHSRLTLSGSFLPHDRSTNTSRWLGQATGNVHYAGGWTGKLNYTQVSDNHYFRDLNITNFTIRRQAHLKQEAVLTHQSERWETQLKAVGYQTIEDDVSDPYERLPQFSVQYRTPASNFAPEPIGLAQWTYFDHDHPDDNPTGQRLFAQGGVRFPMRWTYGFIVPTAKVMHVNYMLNDTADDKPSATVPLGAIDTGLFFDRDLSIGQRLFLQTLEPRLYYVYSPDVSQQDQPNFDSGLWNFNYSQLFRDTRFTGYDRLGDANRLSLAMTSRLVDSDTGVEWITAQVGQIIYFEDRQVQLDSASPAPGSNRATSDIVLGLQYRPSNQLWLSSRLIWDPSQSEVDESGFTFHWVLPGKALYNLGYRFRRNGENFVGTTPRDVNQLNASLAFPVGNHWTFLARYQYDLEQRYSLEELIGFEYENCCFLARLVYQRTVEDETFNKASQKFVVERDSAVLLEFELRGLGRSSARALRLIRGSIWGYDELY